MRILLLIVLVCSLSACADTPSNTISVAELTDREEGILSTISDKSFIFDFQLDREKEIYVWLEKYESGALAQDRIGELMTKEKSGSIIFTMSKIMDNQKELPFNIGVSNEDGTSSLHGLETLTESPTNMSSTWNHFLDTMLINGEMVLAVIGYSNDDGGMNSITTNFYNNPEEHMSELEQYDFAYLLKAEIK